MKNFCRPLPAILLALVLRIKNFCRSLLTKLFKVVLFGVGAFFVLSILASFIINSKTTVAPNSVLVLDLSTSFPESTRDDGPTGFVQRTIHKTTAGGALPLSGVLQALDRASSDSSISALYLTGNVSDSGPAALKELRDAILRFKTESGKPVIAYNDVWTMWEYYVCSCASKLYLDPSGEVRLTGIVAEPMFFAGALKKYGVDVQVTRAGKYKSAVEPYLLDKMSPAAREQISLLLGDVWNDWKDNVASDRKLTSAEVQNISDTQGILMAQGALDAGLVDKLACLSQVLDELKTLTGRKASDSYFPQVTMAKYMSTGTRAKESNNRIALVVAEGEIVDGDGYDRQVGGYRLSRELRKHRLDPEVKAVVMRVNSPGGSSVASELIRQEVTLLREAKKPVVVSMGHLAASGGYLISTCADRIFAEPNTITGSIGVFGLSMNFKKLANNYGVTWDSVQTSKLAGIGTHTRPQSAVELAKIQELVDNFYDQFIGIVAVSRGISKSGVHDIAQGRVWSGRQALKVGLVDELGGIRDATNYAAKLANIEGNYRIAAHVEPMSKLETIIQLLLSGEENQTVGKYRSGLLGEAYNCFGDFVANAQAFNDPRGIYVRVPFNVRFR